MTVNNIKRCYAKTVMSYANLFTNGEDTSKGNSLYTRNMLQFKIFLSIWHPNNKSEIGGNLNLVTWIHRVDRPQNKRLCLLLAIATGAAAYITCV